MRYVEVSLPAGERDRFHRMDGKAGKPHIGNPGGYRAGFPGDGPGPHGWPPGVGRPYVYTGERYPVPPELRTPPGGRRALLPGWSVLLLIPLILLMGLFVVIVFVGRPYAVRGTSMEPTLHEGDRVFVIRYRFGTTPDRGDIVVLRDVAGEPEMLIKRVVAIAGDRVTVANGTLTVNDRYRHRSSTETTRPYQFTVPGDAVFVMGDNETRSFDSRSFGPVGLDKVVGKAVLIFWPPGDAGTL